MLALKAMLDLAATIDGWTQVVRRCAWCQRCADANGEYRVVSALEPSTPVTDGMCPACAARVLAGLATRRSLRDRVAIESGVSVALPSAP